MLVISIRQVCIAPFFLQKNEIKAQVLITRLHGKLCHCNKRMLLHQHILCYNIEGIGKLGKEFGIMLPLMLPVRQGDFLCILDLVESLLFCSCWL
jgi:hypothetical protein